MDKTSLKMKMLYVSPSCRTGRLREHTLSGLLCTSTTAPDITDGGDGNFDWGEIDD